MSPRHTPMTEAHPCLHGITARPLEWATPLLLVWNHARCMRNALAGSLGPSLTRVGMTPMTNLLLESCEVHA
ncbi:hypothetical protein VNO80_01358 [Phaseolus coccineus]|uniref:Uncharacterized protein n=1 Tax=Phaseolus coccineus TaxID=3886 RepID=A0AAN9QDV0_PHACN